MPLFILKNCAWKWPLLIVVLKVFFSLGAANFLKKSCTICCTNWSGLKIIPTNLYHLGWLAQIKGIGIIFIKFLLGFGYIGLVKYIII